jgi:hypothetical protein
MKSQNTKSSAELHQEVRKELNNIKSDINALTGRLSPGQLIDDVIFYPHGRNPGATFDHLKRNPVGTAFLSLGTILLMEDDSHLTLEQKSKNQISKVRDKMNMGPTAKELAADKINEFKDKMAEAKDRLDSAKQTVSEFGEKIPEIPQEAGSAASGWMDKGKQKIHDLDSTTFMALGAGLGIVTGASLPVTQTESQFVDDKFQEKLSGFSTDLQSAINECSNILKDLVIADVKDFKVNLF